MLPEWHPHYDVYSLALVLGIGYWYAERRLRPLVAPESEPATRGQQIAWYTALLLILAVSTWPLHDIGEQALFSVHMVEHLVLALVVPRLILLGLPRWVADRTLGHPKVVPWLRPLARAVPAYFIFTITLVALHWPEVVNLMVTNSLAHFLIHAWLMGAGLLMWLPVVSPTPAIPRLRPSLQMLYLFLHSLLPTIPASFLTFSHGPIYHVYGDAALAYGISPVTDQTTAGVIMKLGMGLLLWITIAVIWFRWTSEERRWERLDSSVSVR